MSLDNLKIIDALGVEVSSGHIVLTIIDAWDWADELDHLIALQEKINTYLNFIESDQIYEDYPDANGQPLRIDLITKFPLPEIAIEFLERASEIAAVLNVTVTYQCGIK